MTTKKRERQKWIAIALHDKEATLREFYSELRYDKEENEYRHDKARYELAEKKTNAKGEIVIKLRKVDKKKQVTKVKKISECLASKFETQKMLFHTIEELGNSEIDKIYDRLFKSKSEAKVGTTNGCLELTIGGKKGRPYKLLMRD